MAFVGNAELIFFEIGLVALVDWGIPTIVRSLLSRRADYTALSKDISWAPPTFLYFALWAVMMLVFMPFAVYRVRLYGDWVTGVNLTQLILFWILQVVIALYFILYEVNLWAAFVASLCALGAAIASTWLFYNLEVLAGTLMLVPAVWIFFDVIIAFALAWHQRNKDPMASMMTKEATWGGVIGVASVAAPRRSPAQTARSRSSPPRPAPQSSLSQTATTPPSIAVNMYQRQSATNQMLPPPPTTTLHNNSRGAPRSRALAMLTPSESAISHV